MLQYDPRDVESIGITNRMLGASSLFEAGKHTDAWRHIVLAMASYARKMGHSEFARLASEFSLLVYNILHPTKG